MQIDVNAHVLGNFLQHLKCLERLQPKFSLLIPIASRVSSYRPGMVKVSTATTLFGKIRFYICHLTTHDDEASGYEDYKDVLVSSVKWAVFHNNHWMRATRIFLLLFPLIRLPFILYYSSVLYIYGGFSQRCLKRCKKNTKNTTPPVRPCIQHFKGRYRTDWEPF